MDVIVQSTRSGVERGPSESDQGRRTPRFRSRPLFPALALAGCSPSEPAAVVSEVDSEVTTQGEALTVWLDEFGGAWSRIRSTAVRGRYRARGLTL